jgi:hypothetical protein
MHDVHYSLILSMVVCGLLSVPSLRLGIPASSLLCVLIGGMHCSRMGIRRTDDEPEANLNLVPAWHLVGAEKVFRQGHSLLQLLLYE